MSKPTVPEPAPISSAITSELAQTSSTDEPTPPTAELVKPEPEATTSDSAEFETPTHEKQINELQSEPEATASDSAAFETPTHEKQINELQPDQARRAVTVCASAIVPP